MLSTSEKKLNEKSEKLKELYKKDAEISKLQREKQIDKVINNTIHMYGSLKGIAGGAVPSIKLLELDKENEAPLGIGE